MNPSPYISNRRNLETLMDEIHLMTREGQLDGVGDMGFFFTGLSLAEAGRSSGSGWMAFV